MSRGARLAAVAVAGIAILLIVWDLTRKGLTTPLPPSAVRVHTSASFVSSAAPRSNTHLENMARRTRGTPMDRRPPPSATSRFGFIRT